jgi:MFS family permease
MQIDTMTTQLRRLPLAALLVASAISHIGDAMALVALPWFVLQSTGSPTLTGFAGAATVLPAFLAGIFGGALIDRVGYRRTTIIADVISGLAIAAIPLLHRSVGLSFPALIVLILLGSLLAVPSLSACRSLLPELAEMAQIPRERANAAFESLQYLSFLVGPPLAGLLIVATDAATVLWVDAISFAIAALLVSTAIPAAPLAASTAARNYASEIMVGLRFLWNDRLLRAIAVSLAITNFLGNTLFTVVMPVYVAMIGARASDLGALIAAQGGGSLIGSLLYGAFGDRLPRRPLWLTAYMAFATLLWVLVFMPPVGVLFAAFLLTGFLGGPVNPLSVTVRQERIPLALRGRVFSSFSAIAMMSSPFGIALAGGAIERSGLLPTVFALACCYTCASVGMFFVPALHQMDGRNQ